MTRTEFYLTKFEVFGDRMKQYPVVFDISSQSKLKLRSKRRNKIENKIASPNHGHGYDFFFVLT